MRPHTMPAAFLALQVDDATLQRELALQQGKAGETNIWTGRRGLGQQRDKAAPRVKEREASRFRCVPLLDVGRTRGSDAHQRTFCLYFAK